MLENSHCLSASITRHWTLWCSEMSFKSHIRILEASTLQKAYDWWKWKMYMSTLRQIEAMGRELKLVCRFFVNAFMFWISWGLWKIFTYLDAFFYLSVQFQFCLENESKKASLKLMKWLHLSKVIHPKWIIIIIFPAPSFMEHFVPFLADSLGFTACNLFWFCLSHFHIQRAAVFRRIAERTIVQYLLSTKW